jgi:hypothetical protein
VSLVPAPSFARRQSGGKGAGVRVRDDGERRLALVVGNSNYARKPLNNPVNDARAVAQVLRESGFEVITGFDLTKARLEEKLLQFGERLKAGKGVGLFYYSGHGMQVDGKNFLLPVEFDIENVPDQRLASNYSTSVDVVLDYMDSAANGFNLIILDACRDNPFEKGWKSARAGGLAAAEAPSGTFIAYATAPNKVASDGNETLSPYTASLINQIRVGGQTIYEVFSNVGREVEEKTARRQQPWIVSSLRNNFCFRGCRQTAASTAYPNSLTDAREDDSPTPPGRGRKSLRVLYSSGVVPAGGKLPSKEVFPHLAEFDTPIKAALEKEGLNVSTLGHLNEEDRQQYFGAINSRYNDSNALRSFQFALIVDPSLSLEDVGVNEQGNFIALATGHLQIINTENGKTILFVNVTPTRGYGNTKLLARGNALRAAALSISDAFIKTVAEHAR